MRLKIVHTVFTKINMSGAIHFLKPKKHENSFINIHLFNDRPFCIWSKNE
jgi:hypothetical protein